MTNDAWKSFDRAGGGRQVRSAALCAVSIALLSVSAVAPAFGQTDDTPPEATAAGTTPAPAVGARLSLGPNGIQTQGVSAAVRIGATYTDNINRSNVNPESDTIPAAGLQLSVAEQRPRLHAQVESDLEYQDYLHHTYASDLVGGFAGTALFGIVPDRLGWAMQENFGDTRANALNAYTPGNRQKVNFFSTGPDIAIPLGSETSILLDGRWSKATFGDKVGNDVQDLGALGLARKLSPTATVSLNASAEHVTYDIAALQVNDYNVDSAYLEIVNGSQRTSLKADLGYSVLHDFAGSKGQPLLRATFAHVLTARTILTFDAGSTFSDAAQVFRVAQSVGGITLNGNDVAVGNDPLRSGYAAIGWSFSGPRTTLRLSVDGERQRHERDTNLDVNRVGGGVAFTRKITPNLSLGIGGSYGHQNYLQEGQILVDWLAETTLSWQMSRSLSLVARAGRYTGSSTTNALYSYTENRGSLFLVARHGT